MKLLISVCNYAGQNMQLWLRNVICWLVNAGSLDACFTRVNCPSARHFSDSSRTTSHFHQFRSTIHSPLTIRINNMSHQDTPPPSSDAQAKSFGIQSIIMEEKTETAVSTPDGTLTAIDALNSVKVSLADLCAKATSHYAYKNYEEAADYFARASELQAELNGEMDPQNAEILFLYGRSLFKVGQSKSDVLGGRAGGEKKKPKGAATSEPAQAESSAAAPSGELEKITEEGNELAPEENRGDTKEDDNKDPKKPLFQFTGDENFEDSDGEEVSLDPQWQWRFHGSFLTLA